MSQLTSDASATAERQTEAERAAREMMARFGIFQALFAIAKEADVMARACRSRAEEMEEGDVDDYGCDARETAATAERWRSIATVTRALARLDPTTSRSLWGDV